MPASPAVEIEVDDRVVRTALMSLPSASVLLVDQDLRYRAAVGAAITYYGFEPAKMIGRLVSDTLAPQTYAFVEPALRRAMAGEMFTEIREITSLGGAAFEMAYGPAVEDGEMLDHRRAAHGQLGGEGRRRAVPVLRQEVEDPTAGRVRECGEDVLGHTATVCA